MLQQLSSVPARVRAAMRKGPKAVVVLSAVLLLGLGASACGQRGPLYLPEGQQLQRPAVRPVTSPPAPPALSPTDTPVTPAPVPTPRPVTEAASAPL
jgi:predicted small lipoprotein YifL